MEEMMLQTAKDAVKLAGEIHMQYYGKTLNVDAKLKNDIKLEVDKLSEKAMLELISSRFPEHSILSEECGELPKDSEYLWIVDPLDGTVNFYYGIPYFCSSAACYHVPGGLEREEGVLYQRLQDFAEPVCGAIFAAPTNELIWAQAGKGAYLNGQRIYASTESEMAECIAVTGMGRTRVASERLLDGENSLASRIRKIRCMGAAAYDIANLACGRFNIFFMRGISLWDFAASALIALEAGADVEAFEYQQGKWSVTSANSSIMPQVRGIIYE